jgi:hypothetical protein
MCGRHVTHRPSHDSIPSDRWPRRFAWRLAWRTRGAPHRRRRWQRFRMRALHPRDLQHVKRCVPWRELLRLYFWRAFARRGVKGEEGFINTLSSSLISHNHSQPDTRSPSCPFEFTNWPSGPAGNESCRLTALDPVPLCLLFVPVPCLHIQTSKFVLSRSQYTWSESKFFKAYLNCCFFLFLW